jgi:metal-responsive CopG/Arc/MetJ family transcriptional regulator
MNVVTFRVEDGLLAKLNTVLKQYHQKRSDFIRDAILAKLEDMEDLEAFEETKNDKIYSLDEVKKHLGLAN